MNIHIARSLNDLQALSESWMALHEQSQTSHPFTSYHWTINWWKTFSQQNFARRDEFFVLSFRDGDTLVGVMPMFVTIYYPLLFGGLRYMRPIGSDANLTEIKGFLSLPGYEEKIAHAFEDFLNDCSREWDFCRWPDIRSHRAEILTEQLAQIDKVENFVIPLPKTWEEFRLSRKRNVREAIRKCMNKPSADGLEFSYERIASPVAIAAALPEFYRLHSLRGAMESGPTHPDYFVVPTHRSLIESIMHSPSREIEPALYVLKLGDKYIAMRLGFEMNGKIFGYYSGFDPAFAAYSVMTRLLVETMKDAIERGLTALNLSTGRDLSKTRWSPDEITYYRPRLMNSRWNLLAKIYRTAKNLRSVRGFARTN